MLCCNAVPCRVVSSIYSTVVVVVVAVDRYAVRGIPSLFPLLAGFVYSTMTMTMTMTTRTTATTTAQGFDPVFVFCVKKILSSHINPIQSNLILSYPILSDPLSRPSVMYCTLTIIITHVTRHTSYVCLSTFTARLEEISKIFN